MGWRRSSSNSSKPSCVCMLCCARLRSADASADKTPGVLTSQDNSIHPAAREQGHLSAYAGGEGAGRAQLRRHGLAHVGSSQLSMKPFCLKTTRAETPEASAGRPEGRNCVACCACAVPAAARSASAQNSRPFWPSRMLLLLGRDPANETIAIGMRGRRATATRCSQGSCCCWWICSRCRRLHTHGLQITASTDSNADPEKLRPHSFCSAIPR